VVQKLSAWVVRGLFDGSRKSGGSPVTGIVTLPDRKDEGNGVRAYEFCGRAPLPSENYLATLQFRPIVEDGSTFVEWTATFDCESADCGSLRQNLEKMFSTWIASLSNAIERGPH
jgi:hypothetical protein